MKYLPLLLLASCLSPPGGLQITGATPEQVPQIHALLAAANTVTHDQKGYLAGDLAIGVLPTRQEVITYCGNTYAIGCNYRSGDGFVVIVWATGLESSLAHEFAHLGLGTYDERIADQYGLYILEEYRK